MAPDLDRVLQIANADTNELILTDSFISVNSALCPIDSQVMTAGSEDFDFVIDGPSFTVSLKADKITVVGEYSYTIEATAVGGTEPTSVTGTMIVTEAEYDCTTATLVELSPLDALDVPRPGVSEVIYSAGEDLISPPETGCT